jgi:hypothetical protein
MQDIGPDIEQLLNRASEDYPLKDPPDKWQVIQESIAAQRTLPGNYRFVRLLLPAVLLIVLVLMGLIVGDAERMIKTNGSVTAQHVTKQIQNIREDQKDPDDGSALNHYPVSADNKTTFIRRDGQASAKRPQPPAVVSVPENVRPYVLTPGDVRVIERQDIGKQVMAEAVSISVDRPTAQPAPQHIGRNNKKGLYYGILAGMDANAIRNQSFGNANFELGAIAGWRFSRLLSVESGISMVKKYYKTRGEYFSMDDMPMPGGAEMMEVNGSSRIVRIPLHIRADFIHQENYRMFTSLGISSYILTEENNQYKLMMNGTENKMFGSYSENKKYFAATVDVSFGYERKLGGSHIKLQPYLQLPVRGIGVGDLPIKSAGIRVGLTRNH